MSRSIRLPVDPLITESIGDDLSLQSYAYQLRDALLELAEAYDEYLITEMFDLEDQLLVEQVLDAGTIDRLLVSAARINKEGRKTAKAQAKASGKAQKALAVVQKAWQKFKDSEPVDNFDKKYQGLRQKILDKNPKLKSGVEGLARIAQDNPKKTAFVIGTLAGLAAVAGTPGGGALVGAGLRAALDVAKGKHVADVLGGAAFTGALAFVAGAGLEKLGSVISDTTALEMKKNVIDELGPGFINQDTTVTVNGAPFGFNGVVPADVHAELKQLGKAAFNMDAPPDAMAKYLTAMDATFNDPQQQAEWAKAAAQRGADLKAAGVEIGQVTSKIDAIANAAAGAAVGGAAARGTRESVEEDSTLILLMELAPAQQFKTPGAFKLRYLWGSQGKPTNVKDIVALLTQKAGMDPENVRAAFKEIGIDASIHLPKAAAPTLVPADGKKEAGPKPKFTDAIKQLDDESLKQAMQAVFPLQSATTSPGAQVGQDPKPKVSLAQAQASRQR